MKKSKGFTLVELMVVIVIIGILAALAIPKFMSASDKAKISEAPLSLKAFETLQNAYIAEKAAPGLAADINWDVTTLNAESRWFTYSTTIAVGPPASGTGTATLDLAVGTLSAGNNITSTVTTTGVLTHATPAGVWTKYLPNWL